MIFGPSSPLKSKILNYLGNISVTQVTDISGLRDIMRSKLDSSSTKFDIKKDHWQDKTALSPYTSNKIPVINIDIDNKFVEKEVQ